MTWCGWRKKSISRQHKHSSSSRNNGTSSTTIVSSRPLHTDLEAITTANQNLLRVNRSPDDCDCAGQSEDIQAAVDGSETRTMGNPRNKCALQPGHSLMDWIRLGASGIDLSGTKGRIVPVSHAELALHNSRTDGWLAIRGKCYNVTRYMDFHPGGADDLMRGVGKDSTKLFEEVHAWVNYEQLLSKCYIGPLVNMATITLDGAKPSVRPTNGFFKTPAQVLPFLQHSPLSSAHTSPARKPIVATTTNDQPSTSTPPIENNNVTPTVEVIPRFDWMQKKSELTVIFYTKTLCNPGVTVEMISELEVIVRIFIQRTLHVCNFKFAHAIRWPCRIQMNYETGKLELVFEKQTPVLWTAFGLLDRRKTGNFSDEVNGATRYDVVTRKAITPDSYALILVPNTKIIHNPPVGHHFRITCSDEASLESTTRSYTPVPAAYTPCQPCPIGGIPLLVKSYPTGTLSKYLTRPPPLAAGLLLSHPKGNFALTTIRQHRRFALLAAGSGVTPILSILHYLLERASNKIEAITLMYFNKTESDIWCREQLDAMALADGRLHVKHVLSEPTSGWPESASGHISVQRAVAIRDSASEAYSTFCFVCGPFAFNEACLKLLQETGYAADSLHIFNG